MFYLTGGPSDVAHPNASDDVARIDRVPVFFGSLPVGHGGTFSAPNGGDRAQVSARWLDWQLKADADAGREFAGADWQRRRSRFQLTGAAWRVFPRWNPPG